MRESRLKRVLASLLPARARRDVFEPAAFDVESEHARAGRAGVRFRLLRRDALFTATVVLTLTLGR